MVRQGHGSFRPIFRAFASRCWAAEALFFISESFPLWKYESGSQR